jgi:sugar phosphate isomerase/epimerase
MNRRAFIKYPLAAAAASAMAGVGLLAPGKVLGIQPIARSGPARLSLSLAAYSFREYFQNSTHKQAPGLDPSKRIDLFQFIDFCADHGCQGTELTSYYFPPTPTDEFLLRLKRHAFMRGIAISGTAVGNTFTLPPGDKRRQQIASVKEWIDYAQLMGAPHIRVFAGSAQGASAPEARKWAIEALQESCAYAAKKGVVLGLENHGGVVSEPEDLLDMVKAVDSPWFGINLDSGNFHTNDPYADLARCLPYAVNVQVKTEIQRRGQKKEAADLPRLIQMLRDAKYQGFVALEYEAAEDPWEAVPRILAQLRDLL